MTFCCHFKALFERQSLKSLNSRKDIFLQRNDKQMETAIIGAVGRGRSAEEVKIVLKKILGSNFLLITTFSNKIGTLQKKYY